MSERRSFVQQQEQCWRDGASDIYIYIEKFHSSEFHESAGSPDKKGSVRVQQL